jgi:hypothetical protein
MAETGHRVALADVVREARIQELRRFGEDHGQLDLFDALEPPSSSESVQARLALQRGRGRPVGARNRRTDEAARFYMARHGDPLSRAIEVAALPILAPGVLPELAKILGCERFEAARWWAGVLASSLPYTHQRLATLTVKPQGSPDGEPVILPWAYGAAETIEAIEGNLDLLTTEEQQEAA